MGYDRGDSFPFDFLNQKWNSISFKKLKGKLSPRSYPIQCERKWKSSFLSVQARLSRAIITYPPFSARMILVHVLAHIFFVHGYIFLIHVGIHFLIHAGIHFLLQGFPSLFYALALA